MARQHNSSGERTSAWRSAKLMANPSPLLPFRAKIRGNCLYVLEVDVSVLMYLSKWPQPFRGEKRVLPVSCTGRWKVSRDLRRRGRKPARPPRTPQSPWSPAPRFWACSQRNRKQRWKGRLHPCVRSCTPHSGRQVGQPGIHRQHEVHPHNEHHPAL